MQLCIEQAAALPTAAGAAYHALHVLGNIKPGQRVLIHAGAGGVGSFAIQFAKIAGAYVISTVSENHFNFLNALGVDELIDYQKHDFSEIASNVDLVIDTLGGDTLERSWKVVKKGGTIVSLVEFSIHPQQTSMVFFASSITMPLTPPLSSTLSRIMDYRLCWIPFIPYQTHVPL